MPNILRRRVLRLWLAVLCFLLLPVAAGADEWPPPNIETYYSSDHRVRFTVSPRDIASPQAYFEGKVRHKKLAGQRPGSAKTVARGVLERLGGDGYWEAVWNRPLVNDVSPVTALVSDSARYAVTFDNWHFVGEGGNVVVIYGPNGSVIRSFSLKDLLPAYYIKALPRSVSSIWWGGEHRISESDDTLILKVIIPSDTDETDNRIYADLAVQLSNGRVLPSTGATWRNALAEASRVVRANQAAEYAAEAAFRAPLLGPATTGELEWYSYLREAFFRLDPQWKDNFPSTTVLRSPDASDYGPSETWVRNMLLEKDLPADIIMLASPSSPNNLIKVLTSVVRDVKPNALKNKRIYVAIPNAYRERVAAALAPTGAKLIDLDPAKPIPQRKERLARN